MDKNNLRIDITDVEAVEFNEEMPAQLKEKITTNVLNVISKTQRKPRHSHWRFAIIAAILMFVISVTSVVASVGNVRSALNKNQSEKTATTESSQQTLQDEQSLSNNDIILQTPARKYVKLNFDNVESYTAIDNQNGWHSLEHSDGYNAGKDIYCQLIYVDSTDCFDKLNAKANNWESLVVGDNNACYKVVKDHDFLTQQLYVFYDDYVLNFMAGSNLEKDELLSCVSQVELVDAENRETASACKSLSKHYEYTFEVDEVVRTGIVEDSYIYDKDDVVEHNGCLYEVTNVGVYDNVLEFTQTPVDKTYSGMKSALLENISEVMSDDGALLPCTRLKYILGNGYSIPKRVYVAEESVTQKFVMIELKVKNISDLLMSDIYVGYRLQYLHQEDGEMYVNGRQYQRDGAYKLCQENKSPVYFGDSVGGIISLEPQEEKIVTMGYFVDEDRLSQMYLSVGSYQFEENVYTPQINLNGVSVE